MMKQFRRNKNTILHFIIFWSFLSLLILGSRVELPGESPENPDQIHTEILRLWRNGNHHKALAKCRYIIEHLDASFHYIYPDMVKISQEKNSKVSSFPAISQQKLSFEFYSKHIRTWDLKIQ